MSCFKYKFSELPYSHMIVSACIRGQREQGKDAGLPLLAACHSCLCNRESTASSETPLTNGPESCASFPLAKSRCYQGTHTHTTAKAGARSADHQPPSHREACKAGTQACH